MSRDRMRCDVDELAVLARRSVNITQTGDADAGLRQYEFNVASGIPIACDRGQNGAHLLIARKTAENVGARP
jgi:hypothetical protein